MKPTLRIKPGVRPRQLQPPQPAEMRRVWCPSCDHQFLASSRAMSLTCPQCTKPLKPKDVHLNCSVRGDVSAIGRVTIPQAMELSGRLLCVELESSGVFQGQARVGGPIRLHPGSSTTGQLNCRALRVEGGASVRISASIGTVTGMHVPNDFLTGAPATSPVVVLPGPSKKRA